MFTRVWLMEMFACVNLQKLSIALFHTFASPKQSQTFFGLE